MCHQGPQRWVWANQCSRLLTNVNLYFMLKWQKFHWRRGKWKWNKLLNKWSITDQCSHSKFQQYIYIVVTENEMKSKKWKKAAIKKDKKYKAKRQSDVLAISAVQSTYQLQSSWTSVFSMFKISDHCSQSKLKSKLEMWFVFQCHFYILYFILLLFYFCFYFISFDFVSFFFYF